MLATAPRTQECPSENQLQDWQDGRLSSSARARLTLHADQCGPCRQLVALLAPSGPAPPAGPGPAQKDGFIDRYEILSILGYGATGVVYTAHDPKLDRRVALKLLRPDATGASGSTELSARLWREAQAMARLDHPNVVGVYDVGQHCGQVYVVMEHVSGGTLSRWLAARRPVRDVLAVFLAAGQGLAAAHRAGLVHRDFKPDNVLLDEQGRVRVSDFGLARLADVTHAPGADAAAPAGPAMMVTVLTQSGALLGTPAYMAPEQLCGQPADARSDQFSFCASFYEALYGTRAFAGQSSAELRRSIEAGPPKAPRGDPVPKWLRQALLRGLRYRPEDRFPSMEHLLAALQKPPLRTHLRRAGLPILCAAALLLRGGSAPQREARRDHPAAASPYEEGLRSYRAFDYLAAIDRFREASVKDPLDPLPHYRLALAYEAMNWTDKRQDALRQARARASAATAAERLAIEAEVSRLQNELPKAIEQLLALLKMTPKGTADADDELEYHLRLSLAQGEAGRYANAMATLEEQRRTPLGAADPRLDAAASYLLYEQRDARQAVTMITRAADKARRGGHWLLLSQVRWQEAFLRRDRGELTEGLAAADESRLLAQKVGDETGAAAAEALMSTFHMRLGELTLALKEADETMRRLPENVSSYIHRSDALLDLGRTAEARQSIEDGVSLTRRIGFRQHVYASLWQLGNVALAQGRTTEARHLFEDTLVVVREDGQQPALASLSSSLGECILLQGHFGEARRALAAALELQERGQIAYEGALTVRRLALLELLTGHAGQALVLSRRAAAELEREGARDEAAQALALWALAARRLDLPEAEQVLGRAQDRAWVSESPLVRLQVDTARAWVLAGTPAGAAARETLLQAAAEGERLGLVPAALAARLVLARTGPRSSREAALRDVLAQAGRLGLLGLARFPP